MTSEIAKDRRSITFLCDDCGEERHTEHLAEGETYCDAWNRAKDDGWRTRQVESRDWKDNVKSAWVHFGPVCVRAFAADRKAEGAPT